MERKIECFCDTSVCSVGHCWALLGKSPHFARSRQGPWPAAPTTESLAFTLAESCGGACKYNGNFRSLQVLKHHEIMWDHKAHALSFALNSVKPFDSSHLITVLLTISTQPKWMSFTGILNRRPGIIGSSPVAQICHQKCEQIWTTCHLLKLLGSFLHSHLFASKSNKSRLFLGWFSITLPVMHCSMSCPPVAWAARYSERAGNMVDKEIHLMVRSTSGVQWSLFLLPIPQDVGTSSNPISNPRSIFCFCNTDPSRYSTSLWKDGPAKIRHLVLRLGSFSPVGTWPV